jgi:hypothetical protein
MRNATSEASEYRSRLGRRVARLGGMKGAGGWTKAGDVSTAMSEANEARNECEVDRSETSNANGEHSDP